MDVGVGGGVVVEMGEPAGVSVRVGSGADSGSIVPVGVNSLVVEWVGVGGLSKPNVQAASRTGARRMIMQILQGLDLQITAEFDPPEPLTSCTSNWNAPII